MNKTQLGEGNLTFTFVNFLNAERFDDSDKNASGLRPVDIFAETSESLYFIEVKDYQNPNQHAAVNQQAEYEMLIAAAKSKKELKKDDLLATKGAVFSLKISQKIKDSLLRQYALGKEITKDVVFLLLVNLDKLGKNERSLLKSKISGHIPTGLNASEYSAFTNISFDLVNAEQLKTKYGIACTAKHSRKEQEILLKN